MGETYSCGTETQSILGNNGYPSISTSIIAYQHETAANYVQKFIPLEVTVMPPPEDVMKALTIQENDDGSLTAIYHGKRFPMTKERPEPHWKRGKSRYDIALLEEPKEKIYRYYEARTIKVKL
jgi:hypothetical protein